jgi:hypothetical protein
MAADQPPAGWYPNPKGPADERYWDGTKWSEQFRSLGSGGQSGGSPPEWRKWVDWLRRHWIPVAAGVGGFVLGAVAGAGGSDQTKTTTSTSTTTVVSNRTETATRTVTKRSKPRRVTVTQTETTEAASAASGGGGGGGSGCDPNYQGACVPTDQGDVDCADISGPVQVVGSDPNDLDRDGDGVACE